MRSSTIILTALFGAGALAHPTLHNLLHGHIKRGEWKEVSDWDKGNVHYEKFEYVDDASAPKPQAESKNKAPSPQPQATAQPKPSPSEHNPPAQSSPPPTTTGSSSQGSSGNSVLDTINSMRAQWIPSLQGHQLAWSDQLLKNVQVTIDGVEQGGKVMEHNINDGPGTFAQIEAVGSADGFKNAMLLWLCEEPQGSIDCSSSSVHQSIPRTGHADILKSTSYATIACKFSVSVWTCDLGY